MEGNSVRRIVVDGVSKSFRTFGGVHEALKGVSFSVDEGSAVVIGGENGSGKSVLMGIIAGLEKPDSGSVSCFGKVGLVFQDADTQILGETPREDVAVGPRNQKRPRKEVDALVEAALARTDLSGGQKRRLAVACMIAMENPIIIFDEPYANLDYGGVRQVNALVSSLKEEGKTVLILTHELEKCLALADRFIVLFRGEKVFDGTPADGLSENLEEWNIRNPLSSYSSVGDLLW
nr:ABC transporter ATP-binding protein [Treponema sp.]